MHCFGLVNPSVDSDGENFCEDISQTLFSNLNRKTHLCLVVFMAQSKSDLAGTTFAMIKMPSSK